MPPRGQPRQPFACLRFPLQTVVVVVGVDIVVVGVDVVVFGVDIVVLGVVLMACYIFIQHHLLMFSIEKKNILLYNNIPGSSQCFLC